MLEQPRRPLDQDLSRDIQAEALKSGLGLPTSFVEYWCDVQRLIRDGGADDLTVTLEKLT